MTSARITKALALVLCAGLWACGDGGGGNDAGSGGSGGGGGTGGDGGTGNAVCGNDAIEAGEECDDGNTIPGDGCDGACQRETVEPGACDDKVDYRGEAVLNDGVRLLVWDIDRTKPSKLAGSCGGEGQETVFSFMTERKGMLLWQVISADLTAPVEGIASYALTSCDASSELACVPDSDVGQVIVNQPGEVLLVVDAASTIDTNIDFNLVTLFVPLKEAGEACDPEGQNDACVEGYICKGTPATCQLGTAPVMTRGATIFGEDPSYFIGEGTDEELDIVGFRIEPLDAGGQPMTIIDTDGDGTPDASEAYLSDAALKNAYQNPGIGFVPTGEGTEFFLVVPVYHSAVGLQVWDPAEDVAEIRVTLVDSTNLESAPLTFGPAVTAGEGEACDNDGFVVCGAGMLCKGDPGVCQLGVAPQVTQAMFGALPDGSGVLVFEGTDPDDDLTTMRFEMLDAEGAVVNYDYGAGPQASLDLTVQTAGDGTFFAAFTTDAEMLAAAASVALTPIDSLGLEGTRFVTPTVTVPVRAAGEACSTVGWDVCGEGYECLGETPTCVTLDEYRGQLCEAAPVVDGTNPGSYSVTGTVTMPSLWEPPAGCGLDFGEPEGTPEGLAVLHLPNGATKVTLTTNNDASRNGGMRDGDTMMYVIAGSCGTDVPLECNDDVNFDGGIYGSIIELNNLSAGDYTVVIDTWYAVSDGGTFQLDVTVE